MAFTTAIVPFLLLYMARLVVWILNDLGLSFLILSAKGDKIFLFFTIAASLLTAHYLSDVNCIRPDNSLYRRLRYSKGIFSLYYLKVVWQRSPLRYKQVQAWRNWYFEIRTNQTDEIIFYTFPSKLKRSDRNSIVVFLNTPASTPSHYVVGT